MYNKKIIEFYSKIKDNKTFNEKLLKDKEKFNNISNPDKRLKKIVTNLIIPIAKKEGYNFTEEELLEHEKKFISNSLSHLNANELALVSGGSNKLIALGLTTLLGISFYTTGTNAIISSSPTYSASLSQTNLNDVAIDNEYPEVLNLAEYLPDGGKNNLGLLRLMLPTGTKPFEIDQNYIANILVDKGISLEILNYIDIEIISDADIIIGENVKNTIINKKSDGTIKSVSVPSFKDPSNIITLTKKSDGTWLLSTLSYSSNFCLEDLENFKNFFGEDINAFEVASGNILIFSKELISASPCWRTKISKSSGNRIYFKDSKPSSSNTGSILQSVISQISTPNLKQPIVSLKDLKTIQPTIHHPTPTSAPSAQASSNEHPEFLKPAEFSPNGDKNNHGLLRLTLKSTGTEPFEIDRNYIANILIDKGINLEVLDDIDIEIVSDANIIIDKYIYNTIINKKSDGTIKSVSVPSFTDHSNIITLTKKSDGTYLLSTYNPRSDFCLEDLEKFESIFGEDIKIIETLRSIHMFPFNSEKASTWHFTTLNSSGNLLYFKITKFDDNYTEKSEVEHKNAEPAVPDTPPLDPDKTQTTDSQSHNKFVGLENIGNSCFLNSLFQQLYNIHSFKSFILTHDFDKETQPTIYGLQILFKEMQQTSENGLNAAVNIRSAIDTINSKSAGFPIYEGRTGDAHEAFTTILDRCSEESNKLKTIIKQEFESQVESTIKHKSDLLSTTLEPETSISLPIDKNLDHQTIQNALNNYSASENISYRQNGSAEITAQKTNKITKFPSTLQITFNRFTYENGSLKKLNNRVAFPRLLQPSATNASILYTLTGITMHSGELDNGHYYSYIKDSNSDNWYELNDDEVSFVGNFDNIKEVCFGNGTSPASAYMLFYSRCLQNN